MSPILSKFLLAGFREHLSKFSANGVQPVVTVKYSTVSSSTSEPGENINGSLRCVAINSLKINGSCTNTNKAKSVAYKSLQRQQ